jgi:Transglycosylase SLT domain
MSIQIDPASASARLSAQGVAYAPTIARAAAKHGVDPTLLAAVAAQETGGPGSNAGRNIVGDQGHGHGLFQIDDRWHGFAKTAAAMDPAQNADYAAGMLSNLLDQYGGNVHEALSAYNSGSPGATGTTTTWGDGSTLGYADSVMRHYNQISGGAPPAAGGGSTGAGAEESPEDSATAEIGNLIASLGTLSSQAQGMPSPPTFPQSQSQSYHRQATDYTQLVGNDDDD